MTSEEMSSLGVYYHYDEADISTGTALVFGPADTPYANCPLFFSVKVPKDYPFTSPTVIMLTSDGLTRFHPNLYVNGKVCLSILGTYSGPSWASTLNIGSVFKSIVSLNEYRLYKEGKNPIWSKFAEVIDEVWPAHLQKIGERITSRADEPMKKYTSIPYGMHGTIRWRDLSARM